VPDYEFFLGGELRLSGDRNENSLVCTDGIAWRTIDDDVYVFKMDGSLHVLEGNVSQFLWSTIDGGEATREGLLQAMLKAFIVGGEMASVDLDEFLKDLSSAGLLVD